MRLILVRHGESEWNAAGIYQGWSDVPLSPLGERQAEATARALAARRDIRPVAVYASPLDRALRTGAVIADALGLAPIPHPGLREINVGAAAGFTHAEIGRRWPGGEERRRGLGLDDGWPEGETGRAFHARVVATIDEIVARHAAEGEAGDGAGEAAVIIVAHGGTIRFALAYLRGDEPGAWPEMPIGNCSLSEVAIGPAGRRVLMIDARDHLGEWRDVAPVARQGEEGAGTREEDDAREAS